MNSKFKLVASTALLITVTGCSTIPDSQTQYNPEWSRAKNISSLFPEMRGHIDEGRSAVKTVIGGVIASPFIATNIIGDLMLNALIKPIELAEKAHLAKQGKDLQSAVLATVGPSCYRGTSLAWQQAQTASTNNQIIRITWDIAGEVFGYVPTSKAKTELEARQFIVNAVINSFAKASDELKIPMKMISDGDGDYILSERSAYSHGNLTWIDNAQGCQYWKDTDSNSKTCRFSVYATKVSNQPIEMPPFLTDKQTFAWKVSPVGTKGLGKTAWPTIIINTGEKNVIDYHALATAASKYLPEYVYVYLPDSEYKNGHERPALLIEKGKVNYFGAPKDVLNNVPD